jgi:cell division septum initiation protein DivIVA
MRTTHEAVTLGPAESASGGPARILELAARSADQLLAEARADAEQIKAVARAEADLILASARSDAERTLVVIEESRARIRGDAARLRQARWERHEQIREHLPTWLAEVDVTEVG